MPSGTYHSEVPSTVLNPDGTVDGHALDLFPKWRKGRFREVNSPARKIPEAAWLKVLDFTSLTFIQRGEIAVIQ